MHKVNVSERVSELREKFTIFNISRNYDLYKKAKLHVRITLSRTKVEYYYRP